VTTEHAFSRANGDALETRVRRILAATFAIAPEGIGLDSGPHSIAAWDSAGHVRLVLALEEAFGIAFDEDEFTELVSLEAIRSALGRHGVTG